MTFFTKYGPAPCDKNCRSDHQTLFPLFGEGLGTRLGCDVGGADDHVHARVRYSGTAYGAVHRYGVVEHGQTNRCLGNPNMKMFVLVTINGEAADDSVIGCLLSAWREGDIYLQLSVLGLAVFVLLCFLICLAWMLYGSVISTVFDAKS